MVERASRSGGKEEVLPVFYNREPSDVKLETSLYKGTLDMLRRTWSADRVERWKKALVEAGNVKGWELRSYKRFPCNLVAQSTGKRKLNDIDIFFQQKMQHWSTLLYCFVHLHSEGELITTIVEEISPKLKIEHKYAPGDLSTGAEPLKTNVALQDRFTGAGSLEAKGKTYEVHTSHSKMELEDSQETKIMKLLELEVNDVRIVGIHGRNGIGKTALVKIVYDQISLRFDACSFLAEIEETVQQPGGVQYLQTKLIFDMLKREYEVASSFKGVRCLKEILRNMKVLLVLDDVENVSLLKEFVGAKLDWFGSGSRIIVTSKQRRVLQGFIDRGVAHTYDVSPMDDNRASDLFWQYAMGKSYKHQPYVEIANKIVRAAEGLPLLVKIFGSFLHGKGQEEWIKFGDLMRQFQEDYQKILSIIYEALDPKQKQMYLDIARFLPEVDCKIASYMWHDYDRPDDGIEVLRRMSLIKTEENKIGMHSMLRCLARKVIYEGFHDPGIRVRFYIPAIAHDTKKRKRGADHLNTIMAGFEILPSTTFLSLGHTNIGGRFADALLNVRWLHWQGCPPDFEANGIYLENLVILDLSWSKMERLKVLNLTGCADLLITPNFSCYPKLEILILERCSRLVHLDPSINDLKLLVTLNLKLCSELNMLPVKMGGMNALRELLIDGTSIRELPESIGKLALLQILSANNCFSLVRVPGSVCELELLSVLALNEAKILELPASIGNLWGLTRLSLSGCRGLGKLPESIGELEDLLVELDISENFLAALER
ncbi:hypothetical protein EUGRSUZ_G00367 [Eucalyptus grandis]|uniref:NB-ARC domain-containing protein n=2 Tax=Eucalyptus grandis TaxID=71139 RepID=A0A059B9Q9_EUCGR|nr:hypothetical protein EUGRSUZ_G00367 [Eucalyptus grandis]